MKKKLILNLLGALMLLTVLAVGSLRDGGDAPPPQCPPENPNCRPLI